MAFGHRDGRRSGRRAFQPTIDGRLETRVLLSSMIRSQTAAGGQAVVITSTTGQQFFVSVTQGTIQATPASNGRVNLIAKGTTSNTLLEINQIIPMHSTTSGAHTFNATLGSHTGILNINSINITSGFINSIEGYHDAVLSGPITANGNAAVNRIALTAINPGGSITTGGDLDTLDVLNDATFSTPAGLTIGRDLNWFEVGGNLTLQNKGDITIARDLGNSAQPAKGTGNAGQGLNVTGNLTIGATGAITVGRNIPFGVVVNGNLSGYSRFTVGGLSLSDFFNDDRGGSVNFTVNGGSTP